jgi:hypothetical protein
VNFSDELHDLALQLEGSGWRTKRRRDWTPAECAAYERWAAQQRTDLDECIRRGETIEDVEVMTHEEAEEAIGEYLWITLTFDSPRHPTNPDSSPPRSMQCPPED